MSRLIHLNGPPGIGKSTLARRYAADHPGVLNCDIDALLPQMLINPLQVDLFSSSATNVGADFVERFLMDSATSSVDRFDRRCAGSPDPWNDQVRTIVAANGGDSELGRCHEGLSQLLLSRPAAVVIESVDGAADQTYDNLCSSLN